MTKSNYSKEMWSTKVQNATTTKTLTTRTTRLNTNVSNAAAATATDAVAAAAAAAAAATTISSLQQLSSLSLMLEYDIDNTLNTIKENAAHLMTMDMSCNCVMPSVETVETLKPSIAATTTTTTMQPLTIEINEMKPQLPPTPPATPNLQNTARKRWKILAKVLRKDSEETVSSSGEEFNEEQAASVRRFKSFDLLRQDSFEDHMTLNCLGRPENWYKYRVVLDGDGPREYSVNIHHMPQRHLTATELMGFNNTGNICVWPSEEALTAFVLSDLAAYHGKWILELGGGFTCLTGLMLSKYAKPYAVHLTDGNEISVENVKKAVSLNELSCYTKCSVLKWEEASARVAAEAEIFEIILSADCLFFDEARSALIDTIRYYLSSHGVALVMAPRRGKTMSLFVEECMAKGFAVEISYRYNETIWQRHLELKNSDLYNEDLHYPVLLRLTKPNRY